MQTVFSYYETFLFVGKKLTIDLNGKTAKLLRITMKSLNTMHTSEAVNFCVQQNYAELKEGKSSVLKT